MGPSKTYRVVGYQQVTSLAASTALTIPAVDQFGNSVKPNAVLMQAEAQNIRWRPDGVAPTTTVGMRLLSTALEPYYYDGPLDRLRFIEAAASAILNIVYLEDGPY